MSKKKVKAAGFNPADLVELATDNPYVHRLIEDASIRENFQRALESGRKAIDRLGSAKNPAKALLDDKKVQAELRTAIESLRDATTSLTEAPKKKRRRRGRKLLLLVGVGGAAAMVGSEDLRTKALDALFGAEEEFQYTPPVSAPADEAPAPVSAA
ncbi:MAG TPA: hypothetical protein VG223_03555 [Solirubrobacteraceae bacterium]|jgi:hypothetical protein|nr:hypothetical protein [Solirubrobacteraceae bacterium]